MNDLFISPKEKHRKKTFRRLKIYALLIIIIFLLWGIYYLISELSIFKINSLEILGQEKVSKAQIVSEIAPEIYNNYTAKLFGLNNIFSWPSGKIRSNNLLVDDISIEKNIWRRQIKISVDERKKYGSWCEALALSSPRCSWFDKNGFIFDSAPETNGKLIFKINSQPTNNILTEGYILKPDLFSNFKKIIETLKINFLVEDFNFNKQNLDLSTKIINGPDLIFNLKFNPEINLTALKNIKEKNRLKGLKIIDLRIPNKIFYR